MTDVEFDLRREIRQLLARLELMPHGSVSSFDQSGGGHHGFGPTQGRLPGGIDRRDDANREGHLLRSHEWFRRRLAGARSLRALESIRDDLLEALNAWKYTPRPVDTSTREGKMTIGMDPRPVETLMTVYGYSRSAIYRFKAEARRLDRELRKNAA